VGQAIANYIIGTDGRYNYSSFIPTKPRTPDSSFYERLKTMKTARFDVLSHAEIERIHAASILSRY
jgi:hypothetical protein